MEARGREPKAWNCYASPARSDPPLGPCAAHKPAAPWTRKDKGKLALRSVSWADLPDQLPPTARREAGATPPAVGPSTGPPPSSAGEDGTSGSSENLRPNLGGPLPQPPSYTSALLATPLPPPSPLRPPPPRTSLRWSRSAPSAAFLRARQEGRCFRCLASDHHRSDCRDPPKCLLCSRFGHFARRCPARRSPGKMNRAMGFRPPCMKVFVPHSEGFFSRQEQRRNAVLATTVGEAHLGVFPQDTIAGDLAARFGGYINDFLVSKYRGRDFILFLPAWVRSEDLVNRGNLRLPSCTLRCFAWAPYGGAPRSRLSYKAWITIVSLPYECWTEARVSALVSCFGRYLRADDATANLHDLAGFRCEVAVDDASDIPESLAISLGDIVVTVPVRLERTAPFGGDDHGTPFLGGDHQEGGDQTDPLGNGLARRIPTRGSASREAVAIGPDEARSFTRIHHRRRANGGPARRPDTARPPSAAAQVLGPPLGPLDNSTAAGTLCPFPFQLASGCLTSPMHCVAAPLGKISNPPFSPPAALSPEVLRPALPVCGIETLTPPPPFASGTPQGGAGFVSVLSGPVVGPPPKLLLAPPPPSRGGPRLSGPPLRGPAPQHPSAGWACGGPAAPAPPSPALAHQVPSSGLGLGGPAPIDHPGLSFALGAWGHPLAEASGPLDPSACRVLVSVAGPLGVRVDLQSEAGRASFVLDLGPSWAWSGFPPPSRGLERPPTPPCPETGAGQLVLGGQLAALDFAASVLPSLPPPVDDLALPQLPSPPSPVGALGPASPGSSPPPCPPPLDCPAHSPRKSARLALLPASRALDRAVRRKALVLGGDRPPRSGSGDPGTSTTAGARRTLRGVATRGARCGVLLEPEDVRSLRDFLCSDSRAGGF